MEANFNIELLGINLVGNQGYNNLITPGRTIPWLQDTTASTANVKERWEAAYRDVVIVDENNNAVAVYNLNATLGHDLALPANRETLKQMLLNAAKAIDGDADKLPDAWELKYVRSNGVSPAVDLDGDGFNHFLEFAFGSNPSDGQDKPNVTVTLNDAGRAVLKYKHWAGDLVNYFVESSSDLEHWQVYPDSSAIVVDQNLYDGKGYFEKTFTLTDSAFDETIRFLRIRGLPQP